MARRPEKSCAVADLFNLLGSPHALNVLYTTMTRTGPVRFKDLQETLGISPNTLAERLKGLVAAGLLHREIFQEMPPRVEYTPLPKAMELMPMFDVLRPWAARHGPTPSEPVPGLPEERDVIYAMPRAKPKGRAMKK